MVELFDEKCACVTALKIIEEKGYTMNALRDDQLLTIVKNVVEQNGCRLVDIDFDNHVLNIEGSEEAQARCAMALENVLG
jgi:hypothetical protein